MSFKVTRAHLPGIAVSATSLLTAIVSGIKWITGNIIPNPAGFCVTGVPSWGAGILTTGLPLLVTVGAVLSLLAPSVSDRINEKAGAAAAKRLSTIPPAPTEIQ